MKKTILPALIFLISLSVSAQMPLNLKFNLKKGEMNHMKVTNKQNIQTTYNGTPFHTEVNSNAFISYKLISHDIDIMSIELKFDTIQTKTVSPMFTKETNSAIPAKSKDYLERMLNRFSANSIIAKISTAGKFIGFENYKTFRDNVLLILDSVPESQKVQIQKQADMLFKESAVRSMIEPLFAYLPEKPVNKGDKWETNVQQSAGGVSSMMFNTFTLDKLENSNVYITQEAEIESIPSNDPDWTMTTDIKGKLSSELILDKTTGSILSSSTKSHSEGTLKVKNQGNEMVMPITVESQSEVQKIQ